MKRLYFHLISLIILFIPISVSAQVGDDEFGVKPEMKVLMENIEEPISKEFDVSNEGYVDVDDIKEDDIRGFPACELRDYEKEGPDEFYVEITLYDADDIDLHTGSYNLKFLVEICSNDVDFEKEGIPVLDFVNSNLKKSDYLKGEQEIIENYYSVEVDGEFYDDMDFHNYPYGGIDLVIEIEMDDMSTNQAVFLIDPETIDEPSEDGKYIPGWVLINWSAEVVEEEKEDGEITSKFQMRYDLVKLFLSNFLLSFFPIFVIVGIVMFNFYMDPHDGNGHKAALGSVLTLVFLQVGFLKGEIPPLDYLTLQDKLLTISYLIISYPIIGNLLQRKYNIDDDLEAKIKLNRKILKFLPVLIAIGVLFLTGIDYVL